MGYTKRENPIQKCRDAAVEKGYTIFAIQDGGQCFSYSDEKSITQITEKFISSDVSRYKTYGPSTACNSEGEGGPMANSVYEIDEFCPAEHPFAYCNGDWCCATKVDMFGNPLTYTECNGCQNTRRIKCRSRFCQNFS